MRKRTLGYKGEARANSFLAAQRYLEKKGFSIETQSGLGNLNYSASTLFLPPSSLNTEGRAKRVLQWVANGGHLVLMLENGTKRGNDFYPYYASSRSSGDELESTPGVEYILSELGAKLVTWENEDLEEIKRDDWEKVEEKDRVLLNSTESDFDIGEENLLVHQWTDQAIHYDLGDGEDDYFYIRDAWGEGGVTLLVDASPLRNRYIAYADHAEFLHSLVTVSRSGTVIFSSGSGDTFLSLVWRYFRYAVIGLGVMVVFWLWKNLPRFGPQQDMPEAQMREFSGQILGIGRFLWRYKRADVMLDSLRGSVYRKLRVDQHRDQAVVFTQIAEHSGLSEESVVEAMTQPSTHDSSLMVRVVKNLQLILKKIN